VFEKALVYRAGVKSKVDLGLLAETIFFYGNTQLLLDRGSLAALVQLMPQHILLELFDSQTIKLSYVRQNFAVMSAGIPVAHDFGAITLHGNTDGTKVRSYQEDITILLERQLGKSRATQRFAQKIADRTALHRFKGVEEKEKIVPDLMRSDLKDADFLHHAVKSILTRLVPGWTANQAFSFRVFKSSKGDYFVDTDLNFEKLNEAFHTVVDPKEDTLTVARILAEIQDARADTFFAAYYMAEPVTGPLSSEIMMLKHFEFLRQRKSNADDIELFNELIVPDFPTLRETINSQERSFEEFVKFLPKAAKFKKFLNQANPDVGLIKSYQDEVTAKSWVETLPGKAIRFVVASGTGLAASALIGPVGGVGVGLANTFLLDRLLKGWKPSRFIEGPYRKFVLPDR